MKRMVLGGLLFIVGALGVLALSIVAALNPWSYNGITGLRGFLLGSGSMFQFILFCVIGIAGIAICTYEAYIKK